MTVKHVHMPEVFRRDSKINSISKKDIKYDQD